MSSELALIAHQHGSAIIEQRASDGYFNATAMCKPHGKNWHDFRRLETTKPYLNALKAETGIPVSELIQSLRGGEPHLQGTWIHPYCAVHLAQWIDPVFAVKVSKWVFDWISGGTPKVQPDLADLVNNALVPSFQKQNEAIAHCANMIAQVDGNVIYLKDGLAKVDDHLERVDGRLDNLEQCMPMKGHAFGKNAWRIWGIVLDRFHDGLEPIEHKIRLRENGKWLADVVQGDHWYGRASGRRSVTEGIPTTKDLNLRLRDPVFRASKEHYFIVFVDQVKIVCDEEEAAKKPAPEAYNYRKDRSTKRCPLTSEFVYD